MDPPPPTPPPHKTPNTFGSETKKERFAAVVEPQIEAKHLAFRAASGSLVGYYLNNRMFYFELRTNTTAMSHLGKICQLMFLLLRVTCDASTKQNVN